MGETKGSRSSGGPKFKGIVIDDPSKLAGSTPKAGMPKKGSGSDIDPMDRPGRLGPPWPPKLSHVRLFRFFDKK